MKTKALPKVFYKYYRLFPERTKGIRGDEVAVAILKQVERIESEQKKETMEGAIGMM